MGAAKGQTVMGAVHQVEWARMSVQTSGHYLLCNSPVSWFGFNQRANKMTRTIFFYTKHISDANHIHRHFF
jgi:hypothetical protein